MPNSGRISSLQVSPFGPLTSRNMFRLSGTVFSENAIGDDGAQALGAALAANFTLATLIACCRCTGRFDTGLGGGSHSCSHPEYD
jgi:hypothetical protein